MFGKAELVRDGEALDAAANNGKWEEDEYAVKGVGVTNSTGVVEVQVGTHDSVRCHVSLALTCVCDD